MSQKSFYVDANIWLNLWKKEGDPTKGTPYWQIAETFFEKIMFSDDKEILYSGFILKELKYKLDEKTFEEKQEFLKNEEKFRFAKATQEDYDFGRKLESEFEFKIGFFDCLHIAMTKRLNAILVTRDEEMLKQAKKYVLADKPENLLS
jgi:predicted nucleic acid-binding protein